MRTPTTNTQQKRKENSSRWISIKNVLNTRRGQDASHLLVYLYTFFMLWLMHLTLRRRTADGNGIVDLFLAFPEHPHPHLTVLCSSEISRGHGS